MKEKIRCLLPLLAVAALAQTGAPVPELEAFDRALNGMLTKYKVPGASVSIAKDGRLVYARGFGIADVTTGEPVQPDSLFRVASVSKPLTAVGVLKLVEQNKVSLDTKVLAFIGRKATGDPRYADITVRHLLQHSGGMDIEAWGVDPSFPDRATLDALGVPLPPSRGDVLDFVLENFPLAFAPGTKYAYSNIGFMFLTEVIEKASGQKYERYMREQIFAPLGIVRMHVAGSLLTERRPGEVRYFDTNPADAPIFPGLPEVVPIPYGTFNIRIFESGGGWLASTPDLVRFLTAFDGGSGYSILRPETIRLISERPSFVPAAATSWYGLSWSIQRSSAGERWDHDGALLGTAAWVFRGVNGISFAIAANHLPDDDLIEAFLTEFETTLNATALAVTRWPAGNVFTSYFPGESPRIADAGVVNAASVRPGPVAAGSVVKVFGANLQRGTVRVNGVRAESLSMEGGDLHVRVPGSASGKVEFQVDGRFGNSNVVTIPVQTVAPAVFTVSGSGYGQAMAVNQNGSVNSAKRPAAPGTIVALLATGVADPVVTVGGQPAELLASHEAPFLPRGVIQINVRLPKDLAEGALPLVVRSGEAKSQAEVTLAVGK